MKAIFLNDTRFNKKHLGCEVVVHNIHELCAKNDIEIVKSYGLWQPDCMASYEDALEDADVVIINGEGTMHDDAIPAIMLGLASKRAKERGVRVALINTVWQNNDLLNDYLPYFDLISTRESRSAANIAKAGHDVIVAPDLSFYGTVKAEEPSKRSGELVVDSVLEEKTRWLYRYALTHRRRLHYMDNKVRLYRSGRIMRVLQALRLIPFCKTLTEADFKKSEFLVTGRFHAFCLALKYDLPFIATRSNTYKIEALLEDIGVDPQGYLFEIDTGLDKAKAMARYEADRDVFRSFIKDAQQRIEEMFMKIRTLN